MTMIRTLVPLQMYVVTYELAYGRPYSKFEELLLKAINEASESGGRTSQELERIFQVHLRLLTEGLVTLIQEGWVAMAQRDSQIHYLVTAEGRSTVATGRRPMRVRTAHTKIVRERLSGQMARANDLSLVTANNLRRLPRGTPRRQALQPKIIRTKINGGEAERLLPRSDNQHEWVRWIDSATRVSQDLHYLPVRVDLDADKVFGLPYQWQHLRDMIVQEVRDRIQQFEADQEFQAALGQLMQSRPERMPSVGGGESTVDHWAAPYAQTVVSCADFTLSGSLGRGLAADLLARAQGSALLIAGHLDQASAVALRDVAIGLRRRGVHCDVLWSCDADQQAAEIGRTISAIRADDSLPGKLSFNRQPATTVADMIITNTADGPVAAVGAGLFGVPAQDDELRPVLRITDPAAVAQLSRICSGWWEEVPGSEAALPVHRWKHLAEQWAGNLARTPAAAQVPVVCPDDPSRDCVGKAVILVGPQQAAFRDRLTVEPSARYLRTEPDRPVNEIIADLAALDGAVGRIFRVLASIRQRVLLPA
ncbi:hypothetical protein [Micromonospora craniellae]|uniref:Uncharacterized protein n=1 Tax=Micromonospora craniellae TaxID=2294034 RepID=A0A372FQ81_9ACTN|nr:hypothetical protein [Micromonospora craniellae]QOC90867.1 hypothetical protein ID554_22680 [Micromonospora craniellae]RFS39014.1 hypothetical protein D0Q02_30930 [Micromonospora craniellae]